LHMIVHRIRSAKHESLVPKWSNEQTLGTTRVAPAIASRPISPRKVGETRV
jgi:hypothetical protein